MIRVILVVALVMAGIVLVSMINKRSHKRHLREIAISRHGVDSWSNFLTDFPEWPQELLLRIYRNIIDLTGVKSFPLLPDDDLFDMLHLDQGDIDDMLETELAGASIDITPFLRKKPDQPVQTVRDMLNWIARSTHIEDYSHGSR